MRAALTSSAVLRHSILRSAFRKPGAPRFNSTSTEKKAQETLASAQKAAGKAWDTAARFLGPAGEKIGNLLGGYKEPLVYNFAVAREVAKRIYVSEALHLPSLSQFSSAYRQIWSNATQAAYWRRLLQTGEIAQVGIYGLQAYGIFKIGEIVGRRHLVGYPVH